MILSQNFLREGRTQRWASYMGQDKNKELISQIIG
jgi:hypothetical protein